MRRASLRPLLSLLLTVTGLCLALPARAQSTASVTITTMLPRTHERPSSQHPLWISYADCIADDKLSFSVQISNPAQNNLQVWVAKTGTDCKPTTSRSGTNPTCWLVYDNIPNIGESIVLRVQDIISQNYPTLSPTGPGSGTSKDCDERTEKTPVPLAIYFMLVDGSQQWTATPAIWDQTQYDLKGPSSLTGVKVDVAEERIRLQWSAPDDPNVAGYVFYCDPPPGGVVGSGPLTIDAGTSAGIVDASPGTITTQLPDGATVTTTATTNPDCPSSALVAGKVPPDGYQCGTLTGKETSGLTNPLSIGTTYAVGVVGIDGVGNAGPLSEIVCATPVQVTDFFESYKAAGGAGGGGVCAVGSPRSGGPGPLTPLAFATAATLVAARRRARRRREAGQAAPTPRRTPLRRQSQLDQRRQGTP